MRFLRLRRGALLGAKNASSKEGYSTFVYAWIDKTSVYSMVFRVIRHFDLCSGIITGVGRGREGHAHEKHHADLGAYKIWRSQGCRAALTTALRGAAKARGGQA